MYASRDSETQADAQGTVNEDDIRGYLTEINVIREGEVIDAQDSLFERGLIDSLGISILINQLEKRAGISVPEFDLLPDNFDSISAITTYVNTRLKAAQKG